jgi:predicted Rossmann fold nucleotide-binding protein DprA/Smf involved in DNA uptake
MNREKKETPAKIAIDNKEESTYSVINKRPTALSDQESAILDLVGTQPELPDSIMDRSDLPSGTVQSILTRLAIKGLVQQHPDGRISRK